jgi:hypothetical protein
LSSLFGVALLAFTVLVRWYPLVRQIVRFPAAATPINWMHQVWPMQWRMAVSMACGYFIFRAITPIVFITSGAISAGRFGLTQVAIDFASQVSSSWLMVRTPTLAKMHSLQMFAKRNQTFRATFSLTLAVYAGCIVLGMVVLETLEPFHPRLASAFLDKGTFLLLAAWAFGNQILQLWATYCRTAGAEPFMKISIASAVATLLGSIPTGYLGGVTGIAVWLAIHNVVLFLPWGWALYRTVRETGVHEPA